VKIPRLWIEFLPTERWQVAINFQCANSRRNRTFLPETHTHTHTHTITHLLALRFSHRSKVGEVQRRANPLSNFDSSHRRFPPPTVAVRITRQARNVVIAEIMAMPTARCGERNDGDYVTLKFNFAIVLRTRGGIPRNFDTVS